jgi:hypothetical protein
MTGFLTLYGYPVIIKSTFLHVDFQPNNMKRSASAPAICRSWVKPQQNQRKRKKITDDAHHDDDLALEESRSMVLVEIWGNLSKGALKKRTNKVLEELETKRMKKRFSMKPDGFIQIVKIMNFNEMDIIVMRSMGMIRDPTGVVDVYLSDEQLLNEGMKKMMKQADIIQGLSKTSFFLMQQTSDVGLVIRFDPHMSTMEIKKRAADFYKIEGAAPIQLERLNGERLKGRTLRKCNVSPGDCIKVVI